MAATTVEIDNATGVLLVDGKKLFPIGFSNPPPRGAKAPSAKPALKELADAGGNFIRVGFKEWNLDDSAQLTELEKRFDEAETHGVRCWLWLGDDTTNLVPTDSSRRDVLQKIVARFRDRPALGAYKGYDEPLWNKIGVDGLAHAYQALKEPNFDPHHPLVLIQAPRMRPPPKPKGGGKGPVVRNGGVALDVAKLKPYSDAFDVTGADIFPISNPPGNQASSAKTDISVVGEVTRKMVAAAQGKPVWMTLQIAHSGTPFPHVPCFPTLQEERFMVYEAIVNGARGISFFGGHMTQVCTPEDAAAGWNWTFWRQVLRPIVKELASPDLQPALLAPNAQPAVTATTPNKQVTDVELVTRRDSSHLYVIAVRWRAGPPTITFSGLPRKHDGTAVTSGEVLFEYVQIPPPGKHPTTHSQVPRPIEVKNGRFTDSFRLHDVHVYRFAL